MVKTDPADAPKTEREERLAKALRANLRRRKAAPPAESDPKDNKSD